MTRILFVCLGNICRSPTAEGVMRALVREQGIEDVEVESAGMGDWHVGHPPDRRATEAAQRRGIALEGAARQVRVSDFDDFDLLIAMDRSNQRDLLALAPDEEAAAKVHLLREWEPGATDLDVPDPYYGDGQGFEDVLDMVQASCRALLAEL
ncbi:low molecular weight protein-tyrosine-phosphatase [Candidatus Solirubrobacter pratensis]|uniref:low molecular weight protein-tyrosine-phosphatase n=1 Tax=Candidatus Solirubrobacter pratensis TaxID=1298857 RepID=UPI0004820649